MDVYNYNCSLQSVLPLLNDNMHDAVLCSKILITLHTCLHDISTYSNNPAAWEYVVCKDDQSEPLCICLATIILS